MAPPAIIFDDVSKRFRRGERHDSLRDLIPAAVAFYLVFQKWNLMTAPEYVGLQNIEHLFNDPLLGLQSARHRQASLSLFRPSTAGAAIRPIQGKVAVPGGAPDSRPTGPDMARPDLLGTVHDLTQAEARYCLAVDTKDSGADFDDQRRFDLANQFGEAGRLLRPEHFDFPPPAFGEGCAVPVRLGAEGSAPLE